MKRVLLGILLTALLLNAFSAALAEPLCDPSEVDLSGIEENNGRLVGEILMPEGLLDGQLLIDCPLPENFTREQSQKLTVEYKRISEREMIVALKTIGQKGTAETVSIFNSNPQTCAEFSLLTCGDLGYYFSAPLMDASASADPAYGTEYVQAKTTVQALLAELGGAAYTNLLHTARLDAEHCILYSPTAQSDGDAWWAEFVESFQNRLAKYKITPDTLTMVSGLYELYNLPVMSVIHWTEGSDSMAAETAFYAAVHDNGTLEYCKLECLPLVTDTEAITFPARNWQELLAEIVANDWCVSADSNDFIYEDTRGQTITEYATYAVITALHPCWIGTDTNTLAPGYFLNLEERVVNDDTLKNVWANFGDAETLTGIH